MSASVRLDRAMELWEESMRGDTIAQGTISGRMSTLRMLIRVTGNLYVKSLNHGHIDKFFATYSHWSPSTRNRHRLDLSAFQKWARKRGYLGEGIDLVEGRRRPSTAKRKQVFLTAEQIEQMLENLKDNPRDRILVALSLHLGLRTNEVTPFKWGDLREDWKRIRVRRLKKGGVVVEDDLPVRGKLRKELARWRLEVCRVLSVAQPDADWYIVCRKVTSAPGRDERGRFIRGEVGYVPTERLTRRGYNAVKDALAKVGITQRGTGTHTLRRTALQIIRHEVDARGENGLRAAQLQAGHNDQATTEGYLDQDADRDIRDSIIETLDDDDDFSDGEERREEAQIIAFPTRAG